MKSSSPPNLYPHPGELIPHRPPMLLVCAVLSHDENHTVCEGWINPALAPDNAAEVSVAFGLELIAQTAAVHHGLRQRANAGQHVAASRGLLLGSRRLQLTTRVLPVGASLRATVFAKDQPPATGGMIRFEGSVANAAGQILVTGDVTVLESI